MLYASKAFVNAGIARVVDEEGLGLDVVSGGELAVAVAAGRRPEQGVLPRKQQDALTSLSTRLRSAAAGSSWTASTSFVCSTTSRKREASLRTSC